MKMHGKESERRNVMYRWFQTAAIKFHIFIGLCIINFENTFVAGKNPNK
jgi:hypothetical protein